MIKSSTYHPVKLYKKSKLIKCKHIYKIPILRSKTIVKSDILDTINTTSYIVGKGIILFTMFYCTINWYHYKELNNKYEKEKEKDKEKEKRKKEK